VQVRYRDSTGVNPSVCKRILISLSRLMQPEIVFSLEESTAAGCPATLIHSAHEVAPGRGKLELYATALAPLDYGYPAGSSDLEFCATDT